MLYFSREETATICQAAKAESKMRLQWIMDVLAREVEKLQSPECEHGVEKGKYCPECELFERNDEGDCY